MKQTFTSTLLFFVATVLFGCSGSETIESDLGIKGAPDWVNEGTQAVSDRDGQLIQGVGMAPPMNDPSLQKSTADNRARAEVARVLSTFIDSTINDYTSNNNGNNSSSIARDIRSATKLALNGAKHVNTFCQFLAEREWSAEYPSRRGEARHMVD